MVMAIPVVMIVAVVIPVPVLVATISLGLADSSQQEGGEKDSHYQQHSAVMPRHYIFHCV